MSGGILGRLHALRAHHDRGRAPLTPEQTEARQRWQRRWNLPIVLAALLPLFTTGAGGREVAEVVIGVGSWLVFLVDLIVQRRIVPDYLHRLNGRVDVGIVVLTFPLYLLPGFSGATAILVLARLARVVRLLMATAGLRRFTARLGRVVVIAGLTVLGCSLVAYAAEHPENPEFANVGDSLWWGVVTLTTVGYGDIVPETSAGRLAGVGIMFTGIAVLGILAGSLASLFGLDRPAAGTEGEEPEPAQTGGAPSVEQELVALGAELSAMQARLGEIAERVRDARGPAGGG